MQRLPENIYLKFNSNTLVALRKTYNLDKPGQMDEAIDLLDAWVKKQSHFVIKDFSREYLERVIILLKGSVERAKAQLDKICTLRTLLPQYFEKCDAKNDYDIIKGVTSWTLLPKLTEDHVRILVIQYTPSQYSPKVFLHIYFYCVLICEYLKKHDYSTGISSIIDIRGVNIMEFVSQLNLTYLKQIFTLFLEGYDTRALNFFFLSTSTAIDLFTKLFKQMMSEKLGRRIHVFKDVTGLHRHISKELLPSDFGGTEKPLAELVGDLMNEMGSEDNIKYFKEMSKAKTIESLRTSTKYTEDFAGIEGTFVGIEGTFRTLSVD